MIPDRLTTIDGVKNYRDPFGYVYFLVYKGDVVYVGQSFSLSRRIISHARDKDFDDVFYIEVAENKLNETERMWIRKFNPLYNIAHKLPARKPIMRGDHPYRAEIYKVKLPSSSGNLRYTKIASWMET